ncbi:MAG: hypothetical protein IJC35_00725 [Oscillospiraceae bacterium]|nr:hypothetical protein [Oscillospiraceae bacterium]
MYTPSEQKFIEAFCKELGGVIFPLNLDVAEKTAAGELQKFFAGYKTDGSKN